MFIDNYIVESSENTTRNMKAELPSLEVVVWTFVYTVVNIVEHQQSPSKRKTQDLRTSTKMKTL